MSWTPFSRATQWSGWKSARHRLDSTGRAGDLVLSPRDGLADLPEVVVGSDLAAGVGSGLSFPTVAIRAEVPGTGPLRIVDEAGRMLAVYRIEEGKAFPEVVIA